MHVPIGDNLYAIRLIHGRLFLDRQEHLSLTDHDRRVIFISDTVPQAARMHLAALAVAEAWQHEVHPVAITTHVS